MKLLLIYSLLALALSAPVEKPAGDDDGVWHDDDHPVGGNRPPIHGGGLVGGNRPHPPLIDSGEEGEVVGGIRPPVGKNSHEIEIIGHNHPPPPPPAGNGDHVDLIGGHRPPHHLGGEVAGGNIPPPAGNGDHIDLVGGQRPPHNIGQLAGGHRPHHNDSDGGDVVGGERPPMHGEGDGDGHLVGGHRPPHHDSGEEGQVVGGHRPPIHGGGEGHLAGGIRPPHGHGLAGGHRPPHHGSGEAAEVVGGHRPPIHGDNGEGQLVGGLRPPFDSDNHEDGMPFVPHHGVPPPNDDSKYPFLRDCTLEAKHSFYVIVHNPDLTKAKMRVEVDNWARIQGPRKVEEVDAWNKDNDAYYGTVRVELAHLIESIPKAYVAINKIQSDNSITKAQEEKEVLAIFNSLDSALQDSLVFLINRIDSRGVTAIPSK